MPTDRTGSSSNQKTVLITGAARGIGEATARAFAAAGWQVGAYDVDPCDWAEGVPGVRTGELDVTNPEQWERALGDFLGLAGALDALINNAGRLYAGPFAEGSFVQDSALVDVNVKGILFGCRAALPFLRRATSPAVVNLCSASALYGQQEMATYSATKLAVRGITEGLDAEWASEGIRVSSVWPLFVPTKLLDGVHTRAMGRLGVRLSADDVAAAVYRAATANPRLPRSHRVHWFVGAQTKALYAAYRLAPTRLVRAVNRGRRR